MFDLDVGKTSFESVDDRASLNKQIKCSNCRPLTLNEVELTGMGQAELTKTHLQDGRVGRFGRDRLSKMRVSLKSSKEVARERKRQYFNQIYYVRHVRIGKFPL